MSKRDVYVNEAMGLAFEQRKLNDRFRELREAVATAGLLEHESDFLFADATKAKDLALYLDEKAHA